jgi:FMN-dependent NADH-azoreductase
MLASFSHSPRQQFRRGDQVAGKGVDRMSTKLLHVISTPRGLASNTGRVSSALLEAILEQDDEVAVTTLDLFKTDLPSVAGRNIESKYKLMTGQALDAASLESWRDIERTIEQFLAADVYLMTVPMWNFGIPYALKYYIDAIVQPGYLFQYTPDGRVEPLVKGKKMICVTSRGSDYSSEPMKAFDFVESYLRTIFGFVGITDMRFFNAQPMDITREMRMAAQKAVIRDVRDFAASGDWRLDGQTAEVAEAYA